MVANGDVDAIERESESESVTVGDLLTAVLAVQGRPHGVLYGEARTWTLMWM